MDGVTPGGRKSRSATERDIRSAAVSACAVMSSPSQYVSTWMPPVRRCCGRDATVRPPGAALPPGSPPSDEPGSAGGSAAAALAESDPAAPLALPAPCSARNASERANMSRRDGRYVS